MTPQEINEAVARKLGWTYSEKDKHWHEPVGGHGGNCWDFPDFANDIAAAWEIIPKFRKWALSGGDQEDVCFSWIEDNSGLQAIRNASAPMAICLAFLKRP